MTSDELSAKSIAELAELTGYTVSELSEAYNYGFDRWALLVRHAVMSRDLEYMNCRSMKWLEENVPGVKDATQISSPMWTNAVTEAQ